MLKIKWVAALSALSFIGTAQATFVPAQLQNDYQLDGSTTDATGGPMLVTNAGSMIGPNGLTFGPNSGPTAMGDGNQTLYDRSPVPDYSLEIEFQLDSSTYSPVTMQQPPGPDGAPGATTTTYPFVKVFDFKGGTSDPGLYINSDGVLEFRTHGAAGLAVIMPDITYHLVFTRSNDRGLQAYINGVAQFLARDPNDPRNMTPTPVDDTAAQAVIDFDSLLIFQDDQETIDPMAGGQLFSFRNYSGTLTDTEVMALFNGGPPPGSSQVPLPASVLLMALLPIAMRRRRAIKRNDD